MREFAIAFLLLGTLCPVAAKPAPVPAGLEKITVNQLEQTLDLSHDKADGDLARQLSGFELTERLNIAKLLQLNTNLPGEKSRQALMILADQSALLDPPDVEILAEPMPDPTATRQMLVKMVNYVNTTLRQLPNFLATRETTGFEDRPQEDVQEATGIVSYSYLPLHFVGKSSATVTYRDRKEAVDESKAKAWAHGSQIGGLVTSGEFGSILSTVLADALKGKITWARWRLDANGKGAVFGYTVPNEKSNYHVRFCCLANGFSSEGLPERQVFDERASYHGEISFNPADGTILGMTLVAEMPPHELVTKAGLMVEYGPVEIGGKSYTCPQRSVSILLAHTTQPHGMYSRADYKGSAKTFLNDVRFGDYRRFGSESHILTGANEVPQN
jgi:hypothetical protein